MASTEERLARLEEHVQEQSNGFSELRDSIRHLEQRFDIRFGGLEQRFLHLEQRVEQRSQYLEQRFDARFDVLDRRLITTLVAIISGAVAVVASLLAR
jgi:hypothetical protein